MSTIPGSPPSAQVPSPAEPTATALRKFDEDDDGLPPSGGIVLDASFVIALLQRHPAATALAHVLPRGVLTTVTAGEVFYKIASTGAADPDRIQAVLRAVGVRIVDLPLAAAHHFPRLRHIDASRRAQQKIKAERVTALSLADLCVLGFAEALKLPVLTGNRHWNTLAGHGLTVQVHVCHT